MEIKLCLFCTHLEYEEGSALSSNTWESSEMSCLKGHWTLLGNLDYQLPDLRKGIQKASTCKDYNLPKEIKNAKSR